MGMFHDPGMARLSHHVLRAAAEGQDTAASAAIRNITRLQAVKECDFTASDVPRGVTSVGEEVASGRWTRRSG